MFVYPITDRKGFDFLKRNLVNLEPDWKLGVDLLCMVQNKNLYTEVRNYLQTDIDRGEVLIIHEPEGNLLKKAKNYIGTKNEYVYLSAEQKIPYNVLEKLYKSYLEKQSLGFVTGIYTTYPEVYWVDDIYNSGEKSPKFFSTDEKEIPGSVVNIDTASPYGMLTKTDLYKELFCMEDLDKFGKYSYGIRLRRKGYQNLLDMSVEFGGKE